MLCLKGQYAPQSNFLLIAETMCCVCHLCYDMFVLWRNEQVLDYLLNGAHGDRMILHTTAEKWNFTILE
jgi:hypothetical protein